jgi:hypothetical protein
MLLQAVTAWGFKIVIFSQIWLYSSYFEPNHTELQLQNVYLFLIRMQLNNNNDDNEVKRRFVSPPLRPPGHAWATLTFPSLLFFF